MQHLKYEYQFITALAYILPDYQFISLHSTGTPGEPDVIACRLGEKLVYIQLKTTTYLSTARNHLKDFKKKYPHVDWLLVSQGDDIYVKQNKFDSTDYKTRKVINDTDDDIFVFKPASDTIIYKVTKFDQATITDF